MTRGARLRYSDRRSGTRIENLHNFQRRGAEPKTASLRGIRGRADPGLTPKATGAPIFRDIGLNPLVPANTGYLLWMLMGFMVVTAVLVVSLGRLGDMFGRVRMYTLGFAVFTLFSILLSITWMRGSDAALYLIVLRVGQGFGGALLMANSPAILTDAFPPDQRGLAMGINNVAMVTGAFIRLILGGLLAPLEWRLVFVVSVPFGLFGTVWAYLKLKDTGIRRRAHIDWWGNLTFAAGLVAILVGITYSLLPYGGHTMGWTSPFVLTMIVGGLGLLVGFGVIEPKVPEPMFRLGLFRIRAFAAGNFANLLAALARWTAGSSCSCAGSRRGAGGR